MKIILLIIVVMVVGFIQKTEAKTITFNNSVKTLFCYFHDQQYSSMRGPQLSLFCRLLNRDEQELLVPKHQHVHDDDCYRWVYVD